MAPHMMCHRSAAAMTVLDGQIYALGGHDGLSIFDSVRQIIFPVLEMIFWWAFNTSLLKG